MKEAIITDLDGFYVEPTLVDDAVTGVFKLYRAAEVEEGEEPQQELYGYQVAVSVPSGLYKPRFDIAARESATEAYSTALEGYYTAMADYDADTDNEPPQRPVPVNLTQFWVEGLSQEEIDAIKNTPRPLTTDDKINLSMEFQNIDIDVAKKEIEVKNKINSGEILATNFNELSDEDQSIAKLALFKQYSPKLEDVPKALSAVEFSLVILTKVLSKAIDRSKLSDEELLLWDAYVSTMSLNDMPIDDVNDWRYSYLHNEFELTQLNRQEYFQKKLDVIGVI